MQQPADTAKSDWENEGGSSAPEPTQETPTGHVIPVPTRESVLSFFKKVAKPKKG